MKASSALTTAAQTSRSTSTTIRNSSTLHMDQTKVLKRHAVVRVMSWYDQRIGASPTAWAITAVAMGGKLL